MIQKKFHNILINDDGIYLSMYKIIILLICSLLIDLTANANDLENKQNIRETHDAYFFGYIDQKNEAISVIPVNKIKDGHDGYMYYWIYTVIATHKQQQIEADIIKYYYQLDCNISKNKTLTSVMYYKQQARYKSGPDQDWSYIVPDSSDERISKLVCNLNKLTKQEINKNLIVLPKQEKDFMQKAQYFYNLLIEK